MKRLFSLTLAAALLCTLCACQKADAPTNTQPDNLTYALMVDGHMLGVMETEEEIQAVLDQHKTSGCTEEDLKNDTLKLEFLQPVEIVPGQYSVAVFSAPEELAETLTQTVAEEIAYTVKEGDTFAGIAKNYGLTTAELQTCNPDCDQKSIQAGDQLVVQTTHPLLQVRMTKTTTYEEVVYHKTITKYREDKPVSYSKVLVEGVHGKKLVEAQQTYVDGVLTETVVLNETTLQEPVTEEKEVGSKTIQGDGIATGEWTWPVPTHRFACNQHSTSLSDSVCCGTEKVLGATCVAADGGTVTYAGWYGNNGWYVKIDHGNGWVTTYSHLQSLDVKAGQKVSNGQKIGKVGSSGYSMGPHLLFEVYKNNVRVKPLNYVTP